MTEWIKASDRLPEKDIEVAVRYIDETDGVLLMNLASYKGALQWSFDCKFGYTSGEVTHWAYLPGEEPLSPK